MTEGTQPEKCTHCNAPMQASWKHCPECGRLNFPDVADQIAQAHQTIIPRDPVAKNPVFAAELADGDIDITPQMRTKYAGEMRGTGIVMILLGLLAFVGVISGLLSSVDDGNIVELMENKFYTYVAIASAGILALMAGVIVLTIPSKDGTMSAITIALGSALSVALGALFAVILVLVIIIAVIVSFINSCMNACQTT